MRYTSKHVCTYFTNITHQHIQWQMGKSFTQVLCERGNTYGKNILERCSTSSVIK